MNLYLNMAGKYYTAEAPVSEGDAHIVNPRPELLTQLRGGESITEDQLIKLNESIANNVITG